MMNGCIEHQVVQCDDQSTIISMHVHSSWVTLNTAVCSIVRADPNRNAYTTAGYKSAMDGKRPSLTSCSMELISTQSGSSQS